MSGQEARPILFSTPLIPRLLDGSKTQTRRLMKPSHARIAANGAVGCDLVWPLCPQGRPGSRLWVREAWRTLALYDELRPSNFPASAEAYFRASDDRTSQPDFPLSARWRPSIHMPRRASRITLEVLSVRVERVQEISEADAKAEGVDEFRAERWTAYDPRTQGYPAFFAEPDATRYENIRKHPDTVISARDRFARLWDDINGRRASWASNPWVWAVTFKRIEQAKAVA